MTILVSVSSPALSQAPIARPTPTCYRTVKNIGKYHSVCIPPAQIDSMKRLVPLWRTKDGKYDYLTTQGQTVKLYRHRPLSGFPYLDHRP